jgi:hypothetical protein
MNIEEIGDGLYIATVDKKLGVSFQTTSEIPKFEPVESTYKKPQELSRTVGKNVQLKFASWGKDNKLPNHIMRLVLNNNLAPGSLDTKDQITLGDQLIFYYNKIENGKIIPTPFYNNELQDTLEMWGVAEYLEEAVIDFNWLANAWAQLSFGNKEGTLKDKIVKIRPVEAVDTRCAVMNPNTKRVEFYGVADWADNRSKEVELFHAWNPDWEPGRMPRSFMIHLKKKTIGNPYYPLPNYIGAQYWIRHANKIPIWKTSNMDNSINIKYHIHVPERYFQQLYPDPQFDRDYRKKKYEEKIAEITKMLTGAENAGKTFSSQILIDPVTGKELPGWKIETIDSKINHEAYSKDFEDANSAILSAIAVDPSLSGVLIPGKMGAGSGSEKRLAYEFHAKVKTRYPRRNLLKPVYIAMKINGLDKMKVDGEMRKVYVGIQDIQFTTLDKNPTGEEKVL